MVVGASSATCLLFTIALKAARRLTSVLPYPTSPQSSRSIFRSLSMSSVISRTLCAWSGVSSQGNSSSNSRCHAVSGPKA